MLAYFFFSRAEKAATISEAQAAPDIMRELWNVALTGTPLIVLLLMAALYYINAERRDVQKRYDDLFKDYVELAHTTQDAIKGIRDMFSSIANRPNRHRGRTDE